MTRKSSKPGPKATTEPRFPSDEEIIRFVADSESRVGKREIARAFHIRGDDRVRLKKVIRELEAAGKLDRGHKGIVHTAGGLPAVTVVEISGVDAHGDLTARPANWLGKDIPPHILIPIRPRTPSLGIGDRALVRLEAQDEGHYEGSIIRKLPASGLLVLGQFTIAEGEGRVIPVEKRARDQYKVMTDDWNGARPGDMVLAEVKHGRPGRLGLKPARIREVLGNLNEPRSISLIAIHTHNIPTEFSDEALAEAEAAKPAPLGNREDLRKIPLITIDPPDARDHDDAVWAAPDDDPANPGGWHLIVAIADVAWYVRPGSALDREAKLRGNSAYFPDRVVPMLPEALSTDLCSLKTGEERACLAVHMWIDSHGRKLRHKFVRGLMRVAAGLTYAETQAAHDGKPGVAAEAILESVIRPLYGAHKALAQGRDARQPLELNVPERQIRLDDEGRVAEIREREHLPAHRLIEDYMILANVAAAEALEELAQPCMYRVHEEPGLDKIEALRGFLDSLGYRLAKGQVLRPALFNGILKKAAGTGESHVINEVILRSQSQAYYSPVNAGHFGLALPRYAHFTSPIRRYADTLVHRALVSGLKLGDGGLSADDRKSFGEAGEHISGTERRAMLAERESTDRYIAAYMAGHLGQIFTGRISGVTRFGLFISIDGTGGDGLIPVSSLYGDYFRHDEARHQLIGEHTGRSYRLGDAVTVRLIEANPVSGGLRLDLIEEGQSAGVAGLPRVRKTRRGPAKRPHAQKSGSPAKPAGQGKPKSHGKTGRKP